ncbi:hypothetical protein L2D08_10640 [Domibacillus sp. PGB-M46]|uniref:hypothetical protein n=1 Tax=Domibacillus sp. PGB-M46 TaxID=2910255 RepID=UPI001F591B70|nr:hypothetical protein [Domibacillus sp. PGB-M46]MCI2254821.1 hypothetical protein [Domibacillus sp. PGB-M46]
MWFQIYKISIRSISRKIKNIDRNIIIGILLLMFIIQISIYTQFSNVLKESIINEVMITKSLVSITGAAAVMGTLLFLYMDKEQNLKSLIHLPLSNQDINRAYYLPNLIIIVFFFIFESIGVLYAVRLVFNNLSQYWCFIISFLLLIINNILITFFVKKLLEKVFSQKKNGYILEILTVFLFSCIYILLFTQEKFLFISPVSWLLRYVFQNENVFLVLFSVSFFMIYFLIEMIIFRTPPYYFVMKVHKSHMNRNLLNILPFNGMALLSAQLIRNLQVAKAFIFSIALGILLTFISYIFFLAEDANAHFQFLIICLGSQLSGIVMYDKETVRALRNIYVDYLVLIKQKVFFIFLLNGITFNVSIIILKFLGVSVSYEQLFSLNTQILFFTSIMFMLNLILERFIENSKMLVGILGLVVYLISIELLNLLDLSQIVTDLVSLFLVSLITYIFVVGYSKALKDVTD